MIPLFKVFMNELAVERVAHTLRSGYVGQGPRVEEFEQAFGRLVEAREPPLALNSGTSALDLALHLCGVGPGDEVLTTPVTCTATNSPIVTRGARPIWCDVDPRTGLIDPRDVAKKVTRRSKAILAVDWGGAPCDYQALKALGPPVIEDAAHGLLTRFEDESIARTGGDYVVWSFQAIKHLTCGDGGALLTPADQTERGRLLRWYGLCRRSQASFRCQQSIEEVGYKFHMNDISASIGLANVSDVPEIVARHRENARWYCDHLENRPGVFVPQYDPASAWWLFTLLVDQRDGFIEHLKRRGIDASPVHARNDKHPGFNFPNGPLPGVDHFTTRNVAIPVGWWLSDKDRQEIAWAVESFPATESFPT